MELLTALYLIIGVYYAGRRIALATEPFEDLILFPITFLIVVGLWPAFYGYNKAVAEKKEGK